METILVFVSRGGKGEEKEDERRGKKREGSLRGRGEKGV